MRWTGLVGETWLLTTLPSTRVLLRASIQRVMIFDAAGLLVPTLDCWLVYRAGAAVTTRP